jgi:hypothetical protein
MGASATAPPIAAAANHGATYLSVVFMMFLFAGRPIWAMPNHGALGDEQFGVNLLAAQAMCPQSPWLACAHNPHNRRFFSFCALCSPMRACGIPWNGPAAPPDRIGVGVPPTAVHHPRSCHRRSALTVGSTCIEYASIVDRMFFVANVIRPATGGQVAGPKEYAAVIVVGWVGQRVNVGRTRTRDLASVRASSDRLTTGPPSLLGLGRKRSILPQVCE